jgi:hypothetical protein
MDVPRLQLDVTDKASISAAHERIAQDEGKLHSTYVGQLG